MQESDFILVTIAVQGTALLMLPVWSAISKRFGKKAAYFMGSGIWIIAQAGLFFLQEGQVVLLYILAVMAGCGVSTAYLIPWSMIPDVTDLDELETGQRREGIFYAFMVLLQKLNTCIRFRELWVEKQVPRKTIAMVGLLVLHQHWQQVFGQVLKTVPYILEA